MKTFKQLHEAKNNNLYHGTSLKQYEKIKENKFDVKDFYVGDSKENITDYYAQKRSQEDDSPQVTITINPRKLTVSLNPDIHSSVNGEVKQLGQFYFTGNIKNAIVKVEMYDEDEDEIIKLKI